MIKIREEIIMPIFVVGAIFTVFFIFYIFLAFIIWLFSDPFDIINISPVGGNPTEYEICVNKASRIYDQFNDTVGASYALGDKPSESVTKFIDHCLENNN